VRHGPALRRRRTAGVQRRWPRRVAGGGPRIGRLPQRAGPWVLRRAALGADGPAAAVRAAERRRLRRSRRARGSLLPWHRVALLGRAEAHPCQGPVRQLARPPCLLLDAVAKRPWARIRIEGR